jgi:pseudaminic acid synthase
MDFNFKKLSEEKSGVFIIAELSANHNQDLSVAIDTIKAAKKTGADAIKLQTYTPDSITLDCDNEYFQINHGTIWDGTTLYKLYQTAYTPWEWHKELFHVAEDVGLICFSSPFDHSAVDLLEGLNCPIYKIASPEITDIPLIKYVAEKQKPVILSSGISRLEDIQLAIDTIRAVGNDQIAILKCTSEYPTPPETANLATIPNIKETFNVIPGLSDHTIGIEASVVATTLGAKIIEKHFILDKSKGGPDVAFSLDMNEFTEMVNAVRKSEQLIGNVDYSLSPKIAEIRKRASRSLFAVKDIKKGDAFTNENIRSIRPGYGLHPKHYYEVLGMKAVQDIEKGHPIILKFLG